MAQAQKLAEPVWGQGFAAPSFVDEFRVAWQRPVGVNHKKLGLLKEGVLLEAMLFRCQDDLPEHIRAVYRPVANEWRDQIELQLYVDYWEAV